VSIERVKRFLKEREGIRLEFKEARTELPTDLFETICAMLNRDGGDIFLGVDNNGRVVGVDPTRTDFLTTNLVNLSNNPQKLDPPFILFPVHHSLHGEIIIHLQVPASSQVHKTNGDVFDRSNDGDFQVTEPHLIAEIYNRKRTYYTESTIYPALSFDDFNPALFPKIRNLIKSNKANHPWLALNDQEILVKAGLRRRDFQSGQEGYSLAAGLLLGKDEVIQQLLPHYKIDALVRKVDIDRYDDREYIQTNLVDAYDRLMEFAAKHLPDKFYLEGDQRRSLRTLIFREVVANLIVHREYMSGHLATFIVYRDRVETENANNPHGEGPILPASFAPFPKNPLIAKLFLELGRVDELGSGVLNVNKFGQHYFPGKRPQFIEGATFRTFVPLDENLVKEHEETLGATLGAVDGTKLALSRHQVEILKKSKEETSLADLIAITGRTDRSKFRNHVLNPLLAEGLIEMTIPEKPRSSKQKYRLTEKGRARLAELKT